MRIVSLLENTVGNAAVGAEHGLSLYIEAAGRRILFDMGQSDLFAENAAALGVDLSTIQSIVGHADVDMTQHYLHVQDGIRQEAIRRFAEAFPIDGHSPEDPNGCACRIIPFPHVG